MSDVNPMTYLASAVIALALIIALMAGVDVKWIVLVLLVGELISAVCKAFVATLRPFIESYNAGMLRNGTRK